MTKEENEPKLQKLLSCNGSMRDGCEEIVVGDYQLIARYTPNGGVNITLTKKGKEISMADTENIDNFEYMVTNPHIIEKLSGKKHPVNRIIIQQ